ncbi:BAG domain-containing protein [Suhomyces tanzawaensis NRRL Y-17324]|uniref:BAG domain-containing protein n=1 Tax=Suhomyces tanzawaensis NRRL Y-17324 TaxID=984487 RepID=A0A1E4SHM7_9ASCO|nr:BAG domain-containing protein [Suhomyces tanzawaensis NRRL Y-17324]ODV78987.1 BAG domain-containing protein [Suhomyces tanzawaensis NRRL Y-17324]
MDQIEQIKAKWPVVLDELKGYLDHAKQVGHPTRVFEHGKAILEGVKKHGVIQEYTTRVEITPLDAKLALGAYVAAGTLLVFGTLYSLYSVLSGPPTKTKKKAKKRLTKAQKANKFIQEILDNVESTFVPEIDEYIENYQSLKSEDVQYKYNYFNEMLLKEIMKLDGVEVGDNEVLRTNRKKVIKFIQDHQKRLDKFKKEVKF